MLTATHEDYRLGSEPVGLPEIGVPVLACTVRRKPMNTEAVFKAFAKAMKFNDAATAGFIQSGAPMPAAVLKELAANGHEQEYSRSAFVEMRRIDANDKEKGQHRDRENGWVCDAMPLLGEYDTVPTHWMPCPEFAPGA
jgi:hypothetical protein